jgi:large subunit ribosomal protein L29
VKIEKVRELGEGELRDKVSDLAEEIFRTRLQKETGQLDQMGKVRELRRDLARVKTVLRQLEIEKSRGQAVGGP